MQTKPIRFWPGVVIAIVLVVARYIAPRLVSDVELFGLPFVVAAMFAALALTLAIVVWWLFFSRVPWTERLSALALAVLGFVGTLRLVDISIAGASMGAWMYIQAIPALALALVVWAVIADRLSIGGRRAALVAAIVLALVPWTLLRTSGTMGMGSKLHWRWTPTPEQRLLAQARDEPTAPLPSPAAPPAAPSEPSVKEPAASTDSKPVIPASNTSAETPSAGKDAVSSATTDPTSRESPRAEWSGFRGPNRDSVVHGVRINTDWSASPPVEMWRRPIGPGWSSFAVRGDLFYTQEQRGDDEIVGCYRLSTGEPVWRHRDAVRFYESNGGAGPRGTPTLHQDRVFAFGATGILNALDATTGKVVWSRNVATDTGRRIPDWGFASSPLIVDDVVIVAAAGTLAGYDIATGNPRWKGPSYGGSYSSPHRATLDGVVQVVLLGGPGVISVDPANGTVFWKHEWSPGPIIQPALTEDGDILVNAIVATGGVGTRRLHVTRESGGWNVEERWTSTGLKPYFNDFVVHGGHAFGFDNNILASINLKDGARNWKGGRYGNGQLMLLADQDVLLVISEEGEVALVGATIDGYKELARFRALDGKTWNHPALLGDVLLVRNGEEMAAFRLPRATPSTTSP
jgi:outer membrane protein assembly factor BamB